MITKFPTLSSSHFLILTPVNAAVLLVTALDNPATSSTSADTAFAFYGLVDARSRLASPYSARGGYPGYCLGISLIRVPWSSLPPTLTQSGDGAVDALLTVARTLKDEYTKARGRHSLLAVQAQMVDTVHSGIRAGNP